VEKQKLQYLIFPSGIMYNKKNNTVRTNEVNSIFAAIASQQSILSPDKKSNLLQDCFLSNNVGWTGFEPATPCTPCKCATGLRHHPNL
jgi:hypothetical protein